MSSKDNMAAPPGFDDFMSYLSGQESANNRRYPGAGVDRAPRVVPEFMNQAGPWGGWSHFGHGFDGPPPPWAGGHLGHPGEGRGGRHWGPGRGPHHRGGPDAHGDRRGPSDDKREATDALPNYTDGEEKAVAEEKAGKETEKNNDGDDDATMREEGDDVADPPEQTPEDPFEGHFRHRFGGRGGGRSSPRGRHGPHGRGGRHGGPPHGDWFAHASGGPGGRCHRGPPRGGPFGGFGGFGPFGGPGGGRHPHHGRHRGPGAPFDFGQMMASMANHPYAHTVREYLEKMQNMGNNNAEACTAAAGGARAADNEEETDTGAFTPPVDIFEHEHSWTVHVSLPGAKKKDIGVNWDADRSVLGISGVIHRPGDEDFIEGMIECERAVGLFSREVPLPPVTSEGAMAGEEVDGDNIVAKMEDGVLIVTVTKAEKEWTDVKKIGIE